jgi:hypothetical protein
MATHRTTQPDEIEPFLFDAGVSRQAAHALAIRFGSIGTICAASDEELTDIKYVGPSAVETIDSMRATHTRWDPRSLLSEEVEADGRTIAVDEIDVPGTLPQSEEERRIAIAEHVLTNTKNLSGNYPGGPITHHEEIRKSMMRWLDRRSGDEPGEDYEQWREAVHALTPQERNRGMIKAHGAATPSERLEKRTQKADAVIEWAEDTFDVVDEELEYLRDEWRDTLVEEAEREAERRTAREFQTNPPAEVNGYERIFQSDDPFVSAYRGWSQGSRHVVVAAYRDENDALQFDEFGYPAWVSNGESPRGIRENKRLSFDDFESSAESIAELRSHLTHWNGAPDHAPGDYPHEVNGWLLEYVDEDRLQKITYVEPDQDEELAADSDDEDEGWTVTYSPPDGEAIEIAAVASLTAARDLLIESALEMMAVEGGGTIREHRKAAEHLEPSEESADDSIPEADYEPPIHVGQLYRRTWKPEEDILTYFDLDENVTYHLLTDGAYNQGWIRKEDSSQGVGHRTHSETVYPDLDEGEGFNAVSTTKAAFHMVSWLQEEIAAFEVPQEVNGWQACSVAAGHGYETPCDDGYVYVESHFDGFSVRTSKPGKSPSAISPRMPDRQDAIAHLLKFVESTNPSEFDRAPPDGRPDSVNPSLEDYT